MWCVPLLGCRASVMGVGPRALVQWPPHSAAGEARRMRAVACRLVPPTHAEETPPGLSWRSGGLRFVGGGAARRGLRRFSA